MQPLRVTGIDSSMVVSIERVLQGKSEQENELRSLFLPALHRINNDVNQLLNDYRNQRLIGMQCLPSPVLVIACLRVTSVVVVSVNIYVGTCEFFKLSSL